MTNPKLGKAAFVRTFVIKVLRFFDFQNLLIEVQGQDNESQKAPKESTSLESMKNSQNYLPESTSIHKYQQFSKVSTNLDLQLWVLMKNLNFKILELFL
jgi:hypothetical protein